MSWVVMKVELVRIVVTCAVINLLYWLVATNQLYGQSRTTQSEDSVIKKLWYPKLNDSNLKSVKLDTMLSVILNFHINGKVFRILSYKDISEHSLPIILMNEDNRIFTFLCLSVDDQYQLDIDVEKMKEFLLKIKNLSLASKVACYKQLISNYEAIDYMYKNQIIIRIQGKK